VSEKEGEFMQHKLNAVAFYEYSFRHPKTLPQIFAMAVMAGRDNGCKNNDSSCLHCRIQ